MSLASTQDLAAVGKRKNLLGGPLIQFLGTDEGRDCLCDEWRKRYPHEVALPDGHPSINPRDVEKMLGPDAKMARMPYGRGRKQRFFFTSSTDKKKFQAWLRQSARNMGEVTDAR